MNKQAKIGLSAAVSAAAYFIVSHYFFSSPGINAQLMKIASEMNKQCPMMVDSDTRMDNVMPGPDNTFTYNYTLVNYLKSELNLESVQEYMTPTLTNNYRTHESMKDFRDNKVILNYSYKDRTGVFLFTITVDPADFDG